MARFGLGAPVYVPVVWLISQNQITMDQLVKEHRLWEVCLYCHLISAPSQTRVIPVYGVIRCVKTPRISTPHANLYT